MVQATRLVSIVAILITSNTVSAVSPPSINILPVHDVAPHWKHTFTLQCSIVDWPGQPTFFWKRNGNTVYPYADSSIIFSSDKQSLVFENVERSQSGNYTCIAAEFHSYLFETSPTVEIKIQEPPSIPQQIEIISKSSDSFAFQWDGVEDVVEYTIKQTPGSLHTTTDTQILISDLTPYTIYEFSVRADNAVGFRGFSDIIQIRTDAAAPTGVLDFAIGVRTATTIQVLWAAPSNEILNGKLMGYTLEVYNLTSGDELLRQQHNYTTNTTQSAISSLTPESTYIIKMSFTTNCCYSSPAIKEGSTVGEGKTVAPTIVPVTERNTAPLTQASLIGIIASAVLVVLLLTLLGIVCYKKRRNTHDKAWNDGTVAGSRDLIPISPPPLYTQHDPALTPPDDSSTDISSHVNNPSISNSFCFNNVTPPPAYHSRSSSNNNSSISDLSNVGTLLPDEDKEDNLTPPRRDTWI